MTGAAFALSVLVQIVPALALPDTVEENAVIVEPRDVPPAVLQLASCDPDGGVTRQRFAGMVLFAFRCPGNNANYVESFVAAKDEAGRDAALLVFPPPPFSRGEAAAELSNVRLFGDMRTIGEIFVDSEHDADAPCRFETMFRLEGRSPRVIFHRHTADCEANSDTRWTVLLDDRSPAERREDWN